MKKLLFVVCALFGFMACTQNYIEEQSAIRTDVPETIKVGFEDNETRIQLNSAQKTVWTKGDLVSVFYRSNANQQWKYDGETGARTAELKRVDAGTSTRDMDRVVVVYPYNKDYYINPETYNVQATLPATQHYLANSYGTDGNIMVSSSEYNQFSLKSVCGWLKLQLTGDGAVVKSIKFRGNNDEQVAGELYINSSDATAMLASDMGGTDDNNAGGNLVFDDTILTEVVLDCGEGVTLGKSTTAFYIALPPQTFANGFTVEIEDTDGYAMEQSTAKTFVVERNTISPMAALEFVNPNRPTQPTPANNEIWYTNGSTTIPTTPRYIDVFGANIVSNTYDAKKECWVIKFDGKVTKIGWYAFAHCDSLTSVTIPDSVTEIEEGAFEDCSNLTSIIIPDSVTTIEDDAFYECTSLTSVTIPNSVTTIGDYAFYYCDSLTSVTIPDSVTKIGEYAFSGCNSLTSVTIGDSVTTIREGAFSWCESLSSVTIPDSVTSIGDCAFCRCYSLTSVTIGDSVTTIGDAAFSHCSSLTSVTIPNSVTTIEGCAFYECSNLTSVTIPDSVTTIGYSAFYECSSLTSVIIGDSVTTIESWAFNNCSSLTSITIPDSVTTIESCVFYGCTSLASVTIPDGVTEIGFAAFSDCSSLQEFNGKFASEDGRCLIIDDTLNSFAPAGLTEYIISNSVTKIGYEAFYDCSNLTSITIPDSVTSIGDFAFQNCFSLTSVTIPDSVTRIGRYAFDSCTSLTNVYCKATTPPVGDSWMFSDNASGRKIYVPMESVEAYKSASYWSGYSDYIEGCNF